MRLLHRAYATAATAVVGSANTEDRSSRSLGRVPEPAVCRNTGRNVMKPQFTTPQPSPYTRMPVVRGSSDPVSSAGSRSGGAPVAEAGSARTARTPYRCITSAASSSRPQASRKRGDSGIHRVSTTSSTPVGAPSSQSTRQLRCGTSSEVAPLAMR